MFTWRTDPELTTHPQRRFAELLHAELTAAAQAGRGPLPALAARARLERSRCVVEAGVDDAGVAPGLVPGRRLLLLEDDDREARPRLDQPPGRRQADEAGAHDGDVGGVRTACHRRFSPLIMTQRPAASQRCLTCRRSGSSARS